MRVERLRRRTRSRGFTLVELMVVIAIIGLLAAVVTVNVMGQTYKARVGRVQADFKAIGDALDLYKVDNGRYPDNITALWERPSDARRWSGPYLKEYPPRDPWGNDYIYVKNSSTDYEITSYGAEGGPGGTEEDADLSSKTINQNQPQ